MQNPTVSWKERCDDLGLQVPTVAKATGYKPRTVRSYREGTRNAPPEFIARVYELIAAVEAVQRGSAA